MQAIWEGLRTACNEPDMNMATLLLRVPPTQWYFLYSNSAGNSFWLNLGIYTASVKNRTLIYCEVFPWAARTWASDLERDDVGGMPVFWDVVNDAKRIHWRSHLALALIEAGCWVPERMSPDGQRLLDYMFKGHLNFPGPAVFWKLTRRLLDMGFELTESGAPHEHYCRELQLSRQNCRTGCVALLGVAQRRPDLRMAMPRPLWQRVARMLWDHYRFAYE